MGLCSFRYLPTNSSALLRLWPWFGRSPYAHSLQPASVFSWARRSRSIVWDVKNKQTTNKTTTLGAKQRSSTCRINGNMYYMSLKMISIPTNKTNKKPQNQQTKENSQQNQQNQQTNTTNQRTPNTPFALSCRSPATQSRATSRTRAAKCLDSLHVPALHGPQYPRFFRGRPKPRQEQVGSWRKNKFPKGLTE